MLSSVVIAGGYLGRLFEGTVRETFCFVPEDCICAGLDQGVEISEIAYVLSGWDVRNMRFGDALAGQHLFPDPARPVINFSSPAVRTFLHRIGNVEHRPRIQTLDHDH